jgi:hypothetical protein
MPVVPADPIARRLVADNLLDDAAAVRTLGRLRLNDDTVSRL